MNKTPKDNERKTFKKLLEREDFYTNEPVLRDFESFSDNKMIYNKNFGNQEDKEPQKHSNNKTKEYRESGTFDNKRLESEFFKVKNSKERGEMQNSIQMKEYEMKYNDMAGLDIYNNEFLSNIDSFKNFESFRMTKGELQSNNTKEIYRQYDLPSDLKEKRKNYDSEKLEAEFKFTSEKFIKPKKRKKSSKLLAEDSFGPIKKDPHVRYSVNPKQLDLNLLGIKKRLKEIGNQADKLRDLEPGLRKHSGDEPGLAYTLGNKKEDYNEMESNQFIFDSFTQKNELKKDLVSNFSSFSQNKSVDKQNETFAMNLLESFGGPPNEILFDLISTWGSSFQIGLSEIKLYDEDINEIEIKRDNLKLYSKNKMVPSFKLPKLVNNRICSQRHEDMFIVDFQRDKKTYTLKINLPLDISIAFMVVWNCNEDISKGVKKCKVFFGNNMIYSGDIKKATGMKSNCKNYTIIHINKLISKNKMRDHLDALALSLGYSTLSSKRRNPSIRDKNIYSNQKSSRKETTPNKKLSGLSKALDKAKTPNPSRKAQREVNSHLKFMNPSDENIGRPSRISNIFSNRNTRQTVGNEKKLHNSRLGDNSYSKMKSNTNAQEILIDHIKYYKNKIIPVSPLINGLTCKLISSWDEKTLIGLNGIEVFNTEGKKVKMTIGNLKVYSKTGKAIMDDESNYKLINEDFNNCDQKKQWVYSTNKKLPLTVKIKFSEAQNIAFIRVWNYNGSRIDAGKGVKNMIIANYEDNTLLFAGSIRKASGMIVRLKKNFEPIFFTKNKTILNKIAKEDWLFNKYSKNNNKEVKQTINDKFLVFINQRPTTAEFNEQMKNQFKSNKSRVMENIIADSSQRNIQGKYSPTNSFLGYNGFITLKTLKIIVLETWDDMKEFSLSGIEFFKDSRQKIPDDCYRITTKNKVISEDQGSFDKCIKAGKPVICRYRVNDENMIEINFKHSYEITFMRIYFSFVNPAHISKGIKRVHLYGNNSLLNDDRGLYLKKGSDLGFMKKYPQQINFPINQVICDVEPRPSHILPISSPSGFTIQINLKSTFGDPYYIGLNGLEIFDVKGNNLLEESNEGNFKMIAEPPGVFILPNMSKDKRKVRNLYNGSNISESYSDVWLAPYVKFDKQYKQNIIVIEFINPIALGAINFWHYTKDTFRSAKGVEILLDGNLIYCNSLNDVKEHLLSSVVFNEAFLTKKMPNATLNPIKDYPVETTELNNEGNILNKKENDLFLDSFRPTTGLHH